MRVEYEFNYVRSRSPVCSGERGAGREGEQQTKKETRERGKGKRRGEIQKGEKETRRESDRVEER